MKIYFIIAEDMHVILKNPDVLKAANAATWQEFDGAVLMDCYLVLGVRDCSADAALLSLSFSRIVFDEVQHFTSFCY